MDGDREREWDKDRDRDRERERERERQRKTERHCSEREAGASTHECSSTNLLHINQNSPTIYISSQKELLPL